MSGTPFTTTFFDFASSRLSFTGEVLPSRREQVRDWLAAAMDSISTDAGFRTDPEIHKHFIYQSSGQTHICVVIESEVNTAIDDNLTVFDTELKIVILGRFNATTTFAGNETVSGSETDGEYLLDDIKRVVYTLMLAEINTTANRRMILGKKGINALGPTYMPNNQGEVRVEFYVKIHAEDREF